MIKKALSYAVWLYSLTMISSGFSFLVTLYMARIISKLEMGKYALFVAIYSLSGALLTSGIDRTLVKFIGENDENYDDLVNMYLTLAIGSILVFAMLGLVVSLFFSHEIWVAVVAIGPFVTTYCAAIIFRAKFEKAKEIMLLMAISLLNSISTICLLHFIKNELAPIIADFVSLFIPAIVAIYIFSVKSKGGYFSCYSRNRDLIKRFFMFAKPLWLAGVAFASNSQLSNFLIKAFLNYQSLGDFYFARRLEMLIYKPVDILTKVLLAAFSIEKDVHIYRFKKVLQINLLVFPSVALLVVNLLPFMLRYIGLEEYMSSKTYVALLICGLPFTCIQAVMGIANIVYNIPEISQKSYVVSTLVVIPFTFLFIYYYGVKGASILPSIYAFLLFATNIYFLWSSAKEHAILSLRYGIVVEILYVLSLLITNYNNSISMVCIIVTGYILLGQLLKTWNVFDIYSLYSSRGKISSQ